MPYKSLIFVNADDVLEIHGQRNTGFMKMLNDTVDPNETAVIIYKGHADVRHFTDETGIAASQVHQEFISQVPAMNGDVVTRDGIVTVTPNEGAKVQIYSYFTTDTQEAYDILASQYHVQKENMLVLHMKEEEQRVAADAGCHTADPMDYNNVMRSLLGLKYGF